MPQGFIASQLSRFTLEKNSARLYENAALGRFFYAFFMRGFIAYNNFHLHRQWPVADCQ